MSQTILSQSDVSAENVFADLRKPRPHPPGEGLAPPGIFPGVTLTKYVLKSLGEPFWQKHAEAYLFGIAVDGTGNVMEIPFGAANFGPETYKPQSVEVGETVAFAFDGWPLALPPVHDFLAVQLLIADSDHTARAAAPIVKVIGEIAGLKEVLAGAITLGLPQAAIVLMLVSKAMEASATLLENDGDDIIARFPFFMGPEHLIADHETTIEGKGATIGIKVTS